MLRTWKAEIERVLADTEAERVLELDSIEDIIMIMRTGWMYDELQKDGISKLAELLSEPAHQDKTEYVLSKLTSYPFQNNPPKKLLSLVRWDEKSDSQCLTLLKTLYWDVAACEMAAKHMSKDGLFSMLRKTRYESAVCLVVFPILLNRLNTPLEDIMGAINSGATAKDLLKDVTLSLTEWLDLAKKFPRLKRVIPQKIVSQHITTDQQLLDVLEKLPLYYDFIEAVPIERQVLLILRHCPKYHPEKYWEIGYAAVDGVISDEGLLQVFNWCSGDWRICRRGVVEMSLAKNIVETLRLCNYHPEVCLTILTAEKNDELSCALPANCHKGCVRAVKLCELFEPEHYAQAGITE